MSHLISNVLSVLGEVVPIVNNSMFQTEMNNAICYYKNMEKLQDSFRMLQAVVEDAERKQVKDKAVQIWLEQLKEVSYAADDLLDEWNTEKQKSEMQKDAEASPAKRLCGFFSSVSDSVKELFFQEDNAHRVVKILEQLDQIVKAKDRFNFRPIQIETSVERRNPTSSLVETKEIFGREGDKQTILSKILSEGSSQVSGVPVICIAGTGGFGKTTLSQFVYNSDEVTNKFEKKMWVCVSNAFDEEKVFKDIIAEADEVVPKSGGWNRLHKCLSDAVKGKLFLLVLDDVWEYKDTFWRQLKLSLDGGSPGSRVLVTTRNTGVGLKMGSAFTHILKGLSNDDCWELFKHRSLQGRENPERFHTVGRILSDRCKGVPLAARVLSSLMLLKASEQDWQNVSNSSIWELTKEENGDGFLPELLFSYYALPPVLRQCFVYCAIFPEDIRIEKDKVVKLWMAEGFMGYNGGDSLENKGAWYFDELEMRSFFQDTERDAEGNIVSCKMHDLVREFALFLLSGPETNDACKSWRYTCKERIGNFKNDDLVDFRAIIEPIAFGLSPEKFEKGLVSLRALELAIYSIPNGKLPDDVGKLLHLRYLCLTQSWITELPETVCDLLNLQTLSLNKCEALASLPERIGELSNLRHLEVEETYALDVMPEGIGKLSHLRTLRKFIVGAEENTLKIGELKNLNHLQGSLEITGLGNIVNVNEVFQADLKKKENLRRLRLEFDPSNNQDQDRYTDKMEIVLRGLAPPPGLKELVILAYPGRRFPPWISLLSKLISLEMKSLSKCVDLPCLGKLPLLKVLSLTSSISVEKMGMDFYGLDRERDGTDIFPRLEKLHFEDMPNLIEWEFPLLNNRRLMPRLSVLNIISCPQLIQLPFRDHEDVFPYLRTLRIKGCSSQLLVGVGRLKSLTELGIGDFKELQYTDVNSEISKISLESNLQVLTIENVDTWEAWRLPFGNNISEVHIKSCKNLRALPALGGLKSLVTLKLRDLPRVTHVGLDFLGMSNSKDPRSKRFPQLKDLEFSNMPEWETWDVPFQNKDTEFFPKLEKLWITRCNKLLALPALGKLKSLEDLKLEELNSLEHLGAEFLGISSHDDTVEDARLTSVFPKLRRLFIAGMAKWKGEEEMMETDQVGPIKVMPRLHFLKLCDCPELAVVPSYMFSDSLRDLMLSECPNLRGSQPYLPPFLDYLTLSGELGDFTRLLPINHNSCNKVTNVALHYCDWELLPGGFNQLTAIETLSIMGCDSLDFTPEDFTYLNTLEVLDIFDCSRLSKSCTRGENWSNTSPPKILIDFNEIDLVYSFEDSDEYLTADEH